MLFCSGESLGRVNGSGGGGMENAADASPVSASTSVILRVRLRVDDDDDDVAVDDLDLVGLAGTRISSACGFVRMVDGEYVDAGLVFFFF